MCDGFANAWSDKLASASNRLQRLLLHRGWQPPQPPCAFTTDPYTNALWKAIGELFKMVLDRVPGVASTERERHRRYPRPFHRSDDLIERNIRPQVQGRPAGVDEQGLGHQQIQRVLLARKGREQHLRITEWLSDAANSHVEKAHQVPRQDMLLEDLEPPTRP